VARDEHLFGGKALRVCVVGKGEGEDSRVYRSEPDSPLPASVS
jgi:hypothetical protein